MMRRLVLALALLSAPAFAEDTYAPPELLSKPPPLPASIDPASAWRLDLPGALREALHRNFGLAIERETVEVARLGITVAGGTFEPTLAGNYTHSHSDSPPMIVQQGMAGEIFSFVDDNWRLSLAQRLETGTKLEVDFISDRARSSAGTAVEPLIYNSSLALSISQPLLRGFSVDRVIPRIDLLHAQLASERERAQIEIQMAAIVEQTEDAYWDVVEALYRYDVEARSRQRAQEQLDLTKRQIAAGLSPQSDLIAVESTLAQRDLGLVQGELAIEQAWDRLRAAMNLPRDQWSKPILPVDTPRFAPQETSPESALQVAIANRPELAQLAIDLENQELAVRKADNDKLPQIDLALSAGVLGQDATYHGALSEFGRADATSYTVGLNLIWTPLQRATGAAAEIERSRQRVAVINRDKAVQDLWAAVRDAVRAQRGAERQVYAAAKSRELTTENLDVEQRRFLSGQSSQLFVAQRQEELANAQIAELDAILGHEKATAALLHATGRLLQERGIVLDVRAPGGPRTSGLGPRPATEAHAGK